MATGVGALFEFEDAAVKWSASFAQASALNRAQLGRIESFIRERNAPAEGWSKIKPLFE